MFADGFSRNTEKVLGAEVRWVHLTDFHIGRADEGQAIAMSSLVKAVETFNEGVDIDLILLTGDIAYSGRADEYERFEATFLLPIKSLAVCRNSKLVGVPGNHDLDCRSALPASWDALGSFRQNLFFQDTPEGISVRKPRAVAFEAYREFVLRNKITSFDPAEACARHFILDFGNYQVAVICLNTCFFSDKDISDERKTPAPSHALRRELAEININIPKLVIGHHPVSWFIHSTQKSFRSLLLDNNAVYLHGHLHEILAAATQDGLESLGFGAVYTASLDTPQKTRFENSFAICEIREGFHVAPYSWDSENGRWASRRALPPDFRNPSTILRDGYHFRLPSDVKPKWSRAKAVASERKGVVPQTVANLGVLSEEEWWAFLTAFHIVKDTSSAPTVLINKSGVLEFIVGSSEDQHLFRCISGQGHIVSQREVEAENTRFDTSEFASTTIVTFGSVDEDARKLAIQIGTRKPFSIVSNHELAEAITGLVPPKLREHMEALAPSEVRASYVVLKQSVGLIVADALKAEWFYILDGSGNMLPGSGKEVNTVRSLISLQLSDARYGTRNDVAEFANLPRTREKFDEEEYRRASAALFDDIKYAPLAALGFKFPKTQLSAVYVPANAEISHDEKTSEKLRQEVEDIVNALPVDDLSKEKLRNYLTSTRLSGHYRDSGAASILYQEHPNLLLLGDPGSGKTCFVKNEILNYCKASKDDANWYRNHIPVYVPLLEASLLLKSEGELADICATLCARRGLSINAEHLKAYINNGRIAFFFDGLDEVSSIEKRAHISDLISELIEDTAGLGNRFVLTSRPAAVEPVQIPDGLVKLELLGLTKEEMRRLATNLLAAELSGSGKSISFSAAEPEKNEVVEKLLADCDAKPGIARLAQNPLLLSLLVMTYANSGPLAAKRHRIYAQAISTLVSVRNREAGQRQLSESDLRKRLGSLALAMYERKVSEIPSKGEVLRLFAEVIRRDLPDSDATAEANSFLQDVAEATGLLFIHTSPSDPLEETVSFMHFSFREYYAAVALIATRGIEEIWKLAEEKRWKEVIGLAAGMIGDSADVAPLISGLLKVRSPEDVVTQSRFLFAFDCALECDVPPESSQRELIRLVEDCISEGAARIDFSLRQDLAKKVADLLEISGSPLISKMLDRGIRSPEPLKCAAFIDMAGEITSSFDLDDSVAEAFDEACKTKDTVISTAIVGALSKSKFFRSDAALGVLRNAFRGSLTAKFAAVRAVESSSSLVLKFWDELVLCTDEASSISAVAAKALLENGLLEEGNSSKPLLEKCLRKWEAFSTNGGANGVRISSNHARVDSMLSSPSLDDRVIGLRLLPWLPKQEHFIHDRLFEVVRNPSVSIDELKAALASIKLTPGISLFAKNRDIDALMALLVSGRRDIRLGALGALTAFNVQDRIVREMLSMVERVSGKEEAEAIELISTFAPDHEDVRALIQERMSAAIARTEEGKFGGKELQRNFLRNLQTAENMKLSADGALARMLADLSLNFRASEAIRAQALRTFGACAPHTAESMAFLTDQLPSERTEFRDVAAPAALSFLRKARKKLESIRGIYPSIPSLKAAAMRRWQEKGPKKSEDIDDTDLRSTRRIIVESNEVLMAYQEYNV